MVNLWEMEANDLLPALTPGIAPWVPLMRIDGPAEPVLRRCKAVIEQEPAPDRRENLLSVAQVLAGLRYDVAGIKAIFRPESTMIESPILTEWLHEESIRTRQKVIRETLSDRFPAVPEDLVSELRAEQNEDRLRTLTRIAYSCPDLAAFRAALAAH